MKLNAPREKEEHGEAQEGEGEQGRGPRRAACPGGVLSGGLKLVYYQRVLNLYQDADDTMHL